MGGPAAFTQISIRIPISDPAELIQQGPASVASPAIGNGAGGVPPIGPPPPPPVTAKHHKRMSSLSTRPQSMHQAQLSALASQNQSQSQNGQSMQGANGNLAPNGQRNVSGASAFSQASSVMSARSAVGTQAQGGDPNSTWEMWDTVRAMCGYHPRLSIMLDLTNPLPPSAGALARWTAEPVKHIWLPATSFISNAKGYPVLSKACQAFLKGLVKNNPTYILAQTTLSRHTAGGSTAYLQYVRHITSQAAALAASTAAGSEFAPGYADYLQAPLQPLMDDLGSATYDVFERDPVKYTQYEEAILLALHDLPAGEKHTIIVVGAGRGPLVACALRALKRANREAAVYAVEKNANAFITLQERKETEWHDSVEIVFGDMRTIDLPVQADIIVSELLGSFADNELSPECLDGAMRFLKPHGISIPMSYTAHLAPLSSAKLHADVIAAAKDPSAAETPYVVMMSQVNVLSAEPPAGSSRCGDRVQQCWIFEHPRSDLILDAAGNPMTNSHNTRSASLTFHIPHSAPCHGLAGYFEAHLYGNVGLSTQPETAHRISPDMTSWFPIFFPFRHPIYLPSGSELEVNMWRLSDNKGKKVWYEWSAESFLPVIHSGPASASARPLSASASAGLTASGSANGAAMNAGANGSLAPTPTGSLTAATRNSHHQLVPASSPMMDAAYSPTRMSFGAVQGLGGLPGAGGEGRIKIGQTGLHNAGGTHSWVGL